MQPQVITALVALLLCVASTTGTARRPYGARQYEETDYNDHDHIGANRQWINCFHKTLPGDPQRYFCCPIYFYEDGPLPGSSCSVNTFPDDPLKYRCCATTGKDVNYLDGGILDLVPPYQPPAN